MAEVDAAGVGTSGAAEEVVEVPATLPDPEDMATDWVMQFHRWGMPY